MSAQGKFKCVECGAVKHINMADLDDLPSCDNDLNPMTLEEVSS